MDELEVWLEGEPGHWTVTGYVSYSPYYAMSSTSPWPAVFRVLQDLINGGALYKVL